MIWEGSGSDPSVCLQEHCKRGEELLARLERWEEVSSPDLHIYEDKVHSFWAQLQDFSQRVNSTGQNMERAIQLYRFLDQVLRMLLKPGDKGEPSITTTISLHVLESGCF